MPATNAWQRLALEPAGHSGVHIHNLPLTLNTTTDCPESKKRLARLRFRNGSNLHPNEQHSCLRAACAGRIQMTASGDSLTNCQKMRTSGIEPEAAHDGVTVYEPRNVVR